MSSPLALSSSACLVCHAPLVKAHIPGLLACPECSFLTADVCLSDAEIEALYGPDYFAGREYRDYLSDRRTHAKHFRKRLRTLLPYVPRAPEKALFEIGCAFGFFLDIARPYFGSVAGADISAQAVEYARTELGLAVTAADFLQLPVGDAGVICLWDTIEHLRSPEQYIERAREWLPAGGIIAITTGDIGSAAARFRGRRWRQIHPPTHLHYFSRRTLTRLLENFGFTVRYAGSEGQFRNVDTIAYILLNIKREHPRIYHALRRTGLLNWDLYINMYDIMYVIAEKRV